MTRLRVLTVDADDGWASDDEEETQIAIPEVYAELLSNDLLSLLLGGHRRYKQWMERAVN